MILIFIFIKATKGFPFAEEISNFMNNKVLPKIENYLNTKIQPLDKTLSPSEMVAVIKNYEKMVHFILVTKSAKYSSSLPEKLDNQFYRSFLFVFTFKIITVQQLILEKRNLSKFVPESIKLLKTTSDPSTHSSMRKQAKRLLLINIFQLFILIINLTTKSKGKQRK